MSHITVINQEAEKALKNAREKAAPQKPQEPDYVAALTGDFVNSMKGLLPGVLFGGVFVHQRPYVTFTDKSSKKVECELGDLLMVCHKRVDSLDWYNAALLQWKKSDKPVFGTSSSDAKQLELYQVWPQFCMKGKMYDIQPKTVTPGAQYGTFYPSKNTKMYVDMPAQKHKVNSDYTFGRFVWNMINWETGRPIDPERTSKDEWSKLIWDLMSNSINAHFNRRRIGKVKCDRAMGDFFDRFFPKGPKGSRLDFILSEGGDCEGSCGGGAVGDGNTTFGGDDGAISLLFIEIDNNQFLGNSK
ncbi:MAG: hypothetical protein II975_01405 [Bacteroidales bacterium]|nr:hypothetical protein [Bacteroidales bacterium]